MVPAPAILRIAWGATLMVFPQPLLRLLPRTSPSPTARAAVRLLGARHVVQGAATARGVLPPAWGAVPDAVHAASMAAMALHSGRWRTAALTDLCVACAFAVGSSRGTRAGRSAPREREPEPR